MIIKRFNILFFTLTLIVFGSCVKKNGFIHDMESSSPLEGVLVKDVNDSSNYLITKMNGKFSFDNCGDLIVVKKGYVTDTLRKYGCKPKGRCFDGHIFYMKKIE